MAVENRLGTGGSGVRGVVLFLLVLLLCASTGAAETIETGERQTLLSEARRLIDKAEIRCRQMGKADAAAKAEITLLLDAAKLKMKDAKDSSGAEPGISLGQEIEEARENGLEITADIYPYTAGSSLLSQVIPDWLHVGGVSRMLERLNDPAVREKMAEEYDEMGRDFNKIMVSYVKNPVNKDIEGMSLADIADKWSKNIVDTVCELMIDERGEAMNVTFWGIEEDVDVMVQHPAVMPCSDGWLLAPTGPLGAGKPHPRCYGAFPRYLNQYVTEKKILRLEDAVRRMTSMPAAKLGLHDRGVLKEGLKADITVFDPKTIRDKGTFSDPHQYPEGISHVIINGAVTIENGEHTGELKGEILLK